MATPTFRAERREPPPQDESSDQVSARQGPPGTGMQLAILASAAFAIAFLVHLQTLGFQFLPTWDDPSYVTNNPWIRGLTLENLRFAFTTPYFANYLPLHLVSYMVDYSIWGLNPFGFHLQSVVLAGLNAALAFLVVRRLFGSLSLGFLAAMLYAVHPSHVEAVAWISIRKDLLSTFFLLITVILYDRATRDRFRPGWYAFSIVTYLLGLLSKVSISTLPLFLLVLDLMRPREGRAFDWKRAIANKIPYGVLALVLVIVNNQAQAKTDLPYTHQPLQYLMVKGNALWMYLGLLTGIPEGRPMYDSPWVGGLHGPLDLVGLLVLPAVFAFAYWRRLRALALGVAWIFALLLPVLVFPLITYMADRYLYAPSLGFCWIVGAGILALGRRVHSEAGRATVVVALTAIVFTLFAVQTYRYEALWKSGDALWTYAGQRSKDLRAISNLAQTRLLERRFDEAERLFLQVAKRGNSADAYAGLALTYLSTYRYDEAQEAMDRSILVMKNKRPNEEASLYYTRGLIEWIREDRDAAIRDWERAARLDPKDPRASARLRSAGVAPPPRPR